MIYLDHNSTSPLLPEAATAMGAAEAEQYANPASQHSEGRRANRALQNAREEIAELLGAKMTGRNADRLIFTSGGSEANNLALNIAMRSGDSSGAPMGSGEWGMGSAPRLIISPIEHPSISAAADYLKTRGCAAERLRVSTAGIVALDSLDQLLASTKSFPTPHSPFPILTSVMLANNETGVVQPLDEIVRRCAAAGVPVHTDASQAVGKLPIDFRALGVAAMTISPHKFGGPRGIGGLLVRGDVPIQPLLHGGAQQLGLRPGTESVTLAVGFLAALKAWQAHREQWAAQMQALRDRFEAAIRTAFPQAIVNGVAAPRLLNTSNIAFVGHDRQALLMSFDLAGLCCSTGSACASGSSEPSPTLLAMQLPREVVNASLRFSIGPNTTATDIDEVVGIVQRVVQSSARIGAVS